jgi:hypothetical protein
MMIRKLDAVRPNEEPQLGAAIVEPLAPEVHVSHGQEVEAVQRHAGIMLARMQAPEIRNAILVADNRLTVDHKAGNPQPPRDNPWNSTGSNQIRAG